MCVLATFTVDLTLPCSRRTTIMAAALSDMPPPIFLSQLPDRFGCAVCLSASCSPPTLTPCDHLFCDGCINGPTRCPTCREAFQPWQLRPSPFIQRTIRELTDELRVRCGRPGCHWTGARKNLAEHDNTCCAKRLLDLEEQIRNDRAEFEARVGRITDVWKRKAGEMAAKLQSSLSETVALRLEKAELQTANDKLAQDLTYCRVDHMTTIARLSPLSHDGIWVVDAKGNSHQCFRRRNYVEEVNEEVNEEMSTKRMRSE